MSNRKTRRAVGAAGAKGKNTNSDATSINPHRDKSIPVWDFSDLRWFARHRGRWWRVRRRFPDEPVRGDVPFSRLVAVHRNQRAALRRWLTCWEDLPRGWWLSDAEIAEIAARSWGKILLLPRRESLVGKDAA